MWLGQLWAETSPSNRRKQMQRPHSQTFGRAWRILQKRGRRIIGTKKMKQKPQSQLNWVYTGSQKLNWQPWSLHGNNLGPLQMFYSHVETPHSESRGFETHSFYWIASSNLNRSLVLLQFDAPWLADIHGRASCNLREIVEEEWLGWGELERREGGKHELGCKNNKQKKKKKNKENLKWNPVFSLEAQRSNHQP